MKSEENNNASKLKVYFSRSYFLIPNIARTLLFPVFDGVLGVTAPKHAIYSHKNKLKHILEIEPCMPTKLDYDRPHPGRHSYFNERATAGISTYVTLGSSSLSMQMIRLGVTRIRR